MQNSLNFLEKKTGNEHNQMHLFFCRKRVVDMFNHAYEGYMKYAYPLDELRPLTCDGHDTWGK